MQKDKLINVYDNLVSEKAFAFYGYFYGVVITIVERQAVSSTTLLNTPLSTTFYSAWNGGIYSVASRFVSNVVPEYAKPLLAGAIVTSTGYAIYKAITQK